MWSVNVMEAAHIMGLTHGHSHTADIDTDQNAWWGDLWQTIPYSLYIDREGLNTSWKAIKQTTRLFYKDGKFSFTRITVFRNLALCLPTDLHYV